MKSKGGIYIIFSILKPERFYIGFIVSNISYTAKGKIKQAYGFIWKYKNVG